MNAQDFIIKIISEIESLCKKSYDNSLNNTRGSQNVFVAIKMCEVLDDALQMHSDDLDPAINKIIKQFLKDVTYNLKWCVTNDIVEVGRLHGVLQRVCGQCEGFLPFLKHFFFDPVKEAEKAKKQEQLNQEVEKAKLEIELQKNLLSQEHDKFAK